MTTATLRQVGIDDSIARETDCRQIVSCGVMSTPALTIDGGVKTTGRVPCVEENADLITSIG